MGNRLLVRRDGHGATSWRQATTGCIIANDVQSSTGWAVLTAKRHYARVPLQTGKIGLPNWAARGGLGERNEQGSGSALSVKVWIEYPIGSGNYVQAPYSGSTGAFAIPDNATAFSDETWFGIPEGAAFKTWTYASSAGLIVYHRLPTGALISTADGEGCQMGASGVPTTPGTVTDGFTGARAYSPCAIIARHSRRSFFIIGDSRTSGQSDTADISTDLGSIARSIGPTVPYINAGCGGDNASTMPNNSPRRLELAAYCDAAVVQPGINDLVGGVGAANAILPYRQLLAAQLTLAEPKAIFFTTAEPRTTGTFSTQGGQSTFANESERVSFNTAVRTGSNSGAPFFELADPVEVSRNGGKWATASGAYSADGIHSNIAAYLVQRSSGAINASGVKAGSKLVYRRPSCDLTFTGGAFGAAKFSNGLIAGRGAAHIAPPNYPFTYECWFKRGSIPASNTEVMLGHFQHGWIGLTTSGFITGQVYGITAMTGAVNLCDNAWHHAVLERERTGVGVTARNTLYVDGSVIVQTTTMGTYQAAPVYPFAIGTQGGGPSSTDWLAGTIDEVAVWATGHYGGTGFTPPTVAYTGSEAGLYCAWHLEADGAATYGNLT